MANRGEIACRILRACKEAGHPTVAICAPNDEGSLFTELADEVVLLSGETIAETYPVSYTHLTLPTITEV